MNHHPCMRLSPAYAGIHSSRLPSFCLHAQFYLGTIRLQLEHKGDEHHTFTGIANIVPAFGFLGIPVIGWLLDTKGFGITLGTINFLGVLASLFEAMPSLGFQASTLQVP